MEEAKYSTSDLYLSAFLKSNGQKMSVVKNKNKATFVFDETQELNTLVNNYLTDDAQCNPLSFANAIKNIKNLLYNL